VAVHCEDTGAWLEPCVGESTGPHDSHKIDTYFQMWIIVALQRWNCSYVTRADYRSWGVVLKGRVHVPDNFYRNTKTEIRAK
jgi:hypothetical protein